MQELSSKPGSAEELNQSLNALSQRAIQANLKDFNQVMDLVLSFRDWTQRALSAGVAGCENHHAQAQEFVLHLKNRAPVAQVMEKFLRLLLQTHRLLEQDQHISSSKREKETDSPQPFRRNIRKAEIYRKTSPAAPLIPSFPSAQRPQMNIRSEDSGFFQIFLLDVSGRLEEAQSQLAELATGNKSDVSFLYRTLHELRTQFGFLGFLDVWRLGREIEKHLDPLMGGHLTVTDDLKDGISQSLSFMRAQTAQVEEGLELLAVTVLDSLSLLEKMKALPTPAAPKEEGDGLHLAPETEFGLPPPGGTKRIPHQQLDGLYQDLVDLVLAQNRILDDYRNHARPQGLAEVAHLQKATMRLRDGFLSLGMSPVESLLAQTAQQAGALARRRNLMVEITVEGAGIEVDQRLLPELKEPLTQLIENAIDHGFESPAERRALGKRLEGKLLIRASHQNGAFLLEVEDDGRGLNPEPIRQRALELGWLGQDKISPSRLLEFIFKPGFALKESGPDGAHRGLDTVRRKMESLLGSVRVEGRPGQGCRFTLKIPRSLALMDGWVVKAAGKHYLIPVAQTLKIESGAKTGKPSADEVIPEMDLARYFGGTTGSPSSPLAVRVEAGFQQARLLVDEVTGKQQVLVKNNPEGNSVPAGLRAEALLADGTTGWILDIASLLREQNGEKPMKGTLHGD